MIVRISRGRFDPTRTNEVAEMLRASDEKLAPAIKQLPGLQSYQTGIDRASALIIAISLWDTTEQAAAMGKLPEMNEQRAIFEAYGIVFDPITTYEILWQV
jgi:hypothetical protein